VKTLKIKNLKFGTYPIIFHHHGRPSLNEVGYKIKRQFFNYIAPSFPENFFKDTKNKREVYPIPICHGKEAVEDLSIVLFSNYPWKGSGRLSLEHFGLDYSVIGQDVQGFKHINKMQELMRFSKDCRSKYILYIDDPDLFCISKLGDIVSRFKKFNCKMLFQGDGWFYPRSNSELAKKTKSFLDNLRPDSPYKYLNSGAFIFETSFFNNVSDSIINGESYNKDICQSTYMSAFPHLYPETKIDYRCEIFQSTAWSKWFTERYGSLDFEITGKE